MVEKKGGEGRKKEKNSIPPPPEKPQETVETHTKEVKIFST
jgi:hypothetical protein